MGGCFFWKLYRFTALLRLYLFRLTPICDVPCFPVAIPLRLRFNSTCVHFGFKTFRYSAHTRPIEDPTTMASDALCGCECRWPQKDLSNGPDDSDEYILCECTRCGTFPHHGCLHKCLNHLRWVLAQRLGKPLTDRDRAAFCDADLMDDEFKQKFPLLCEECREYAESREWKRRDVQEKPSLCEDCRGIWEEAKEKKMPRPKKEHAQEKKMPRQKHSRGQ